MKIELIMTKELKRLFKGLSSSRVGLGALQFLFTRTYVDIGGIDAGRVKLSMLRVPYEPVSNFPKPVSIEGDYCLRILSNILDGETITIEEYTDESQHYGVKLSLNNREFTFTEYANVPLIKMNSLDTIYMDKREKKSYSIINKKTKEILDNHVYDRKTAVRYIQANPDIYKDAEIKEHSTIITQDFCEFEMEWKEWQYILREMNLMNFDVFELSTEDGWIQIYSENYYYTYKRKLISLSKCRKTSEIKKSTFALKNFDRNIYQPIKIQIADDQPICLSFEYEGIILRQFIAPRIEEFEDDD